MKLNKIKNLVTSLAPTLGAAIGGPLGGQAGQILSQVLGVKNSPVEIEKAINNLTACLLYTSPSPRDRQKSRMPSSA